MHELLHLTGGDNGSGAWYLEWSGFIALLGFLSLFGVIYRKLNCHQTGCHRIGLHKVGDGSLVVCRKHHPVHGKVKRITATHIANHHHEFIERML